MAKKKPHPRSCNKCRNMGTESDGNFAEFIQIWPSCEMNDKYQWLKSFPFKKRMPCFGYHLAVDEFKSWETELYAGGVWAPHDMERVLALEAVGEVYR